MEEPCLLVVSEFARRDRHDERLRRLGWTLVLAGFLVAEAIWGTRFEDAARPRLTGAVSDLELQYNAGAATAPIPPKPAGVRRLIYLSNSHALTGGRVSSHLQKLLDALEPTRWQVMDVSAPGIFAPEMLERGVLGLSFEPDLYVVAPGYISFGDKMRLSLQSLSARSFFNPGVVEHIPLDFWWRNYDLGLYLDALAGRYLRLIRYRNRLRQSWQVPLRDELSTLTGDPVVLSLGRSQRQSWRFPDGYDRNLFQWRLYAGDRDGHLQDMADLLSLLAEKGVPVFGSNLPLDTAKSVYSADSEDLRAYRREMAGLFVDIADYTDQAEYFPVAFSTYDAIHPTWFGARLHALDLALRMFDRGWLPEVQRREAILELALDADVPLGPSYRRAAVGKGSGDVHPNAFLRYDLTDSTAVAQIVGTLLAAPVGRQRERQLMGGLSQRIDWWRRASPEDDRKRVCTHDVLLCRAFDTWRAQTRQRVDYLSKELTRIELERLGPYPIPSIDAATRQSMGCYPDKYDLELCIDRFSPLESGIMTGVEILRLSVRDGPVFAWDVVDSGNGHHYQRVDPLGDGSFTLLRPDPNAVWVPYWLRGKPDRRWGI